MVSNNENTWERVIHGLYIPGTCINGLCNIYLETTLYIVSIFTWDSGGWVIWLYLVIVKFDNGIYGRSI